MDPEAAELNTRQLPFPFKNKTLTIMRLLYYALAIVLLLSSCHKKQVAFKSSKVVTEDIDNFWTAYDKIVSTADSAEQYAYLETLFIQKGTPGLRAIMQVRRYTAASYVQAIKSYPLFWQSIRENTYLAKGFAHDIEADIRKLKKLYPDLKPATIYFTIGAFKTNGTVLDSSVLIGSELALADEATVTSEFPGTLSHLRPFFDSNPINQVVFLNVHEYVHTQQNTTIGDNLLTQCLIEGVAEFVAEKATGKPSQSPAIGYGKVHDQKIKEKFSREMFSPWLNNWVWNSPDNEFGIRDLGYYMGYAIAEKYYGQAKNKKQAIKEMIEMDYKDRQAVELFVDKAAYLDKPVEALKLAFEKSRPSVISIDGLENGDQQVSPDLKQFTIEFSEPMDVRFRSTDLGELGKDHFPKDLTITFSEDGRKATYQVELERDKRYQLIVESGYRTKAAIPLKPYQIEFKTAE